MFRISTLLYHLSKRYISKTFRESKTCLTILDLPHPKSFPVIGTKLDLLLAGRGKKLHEYVDYRHSVLGPIFTEKLSGNTDLVFISNPELIKSIFINLEGKYPVHILPDPWILYEKIYGSQRGLFFMNGEEWLSNRRILNKYLLRECAEDWISPSVKETIKKFIIKLKIQSEKGYPVRNMESELYKLSIDVIINVLLGTNTLSRSKHYDEMLKTFATSVRKIFVTTTKLYAWPVEWCQQFNLKVWRDFKESVDLSLCLAKKISKEMIENSSESNGLIKRLIQDNMKEEIIIRIIADFIIAAGDTTAFTTLWTLLMLSRNEEVIKEIRIKDRAYVKFVVKESMRMYPVAPFLTRILPQDTCLHKYTLKKGTPIIASLYTSGRDEKNFSKANLFLPQRWERNNQNKENLVNHVPSASLPFAIGARSCIGKKIAMVQLVEVISEIVKNFDFTCTNKENINCITSQVLVPDKHLELYFTLRNNEK